MSVFKAGSILAVRSLVEFLFTLNSLIFTHSCPKFSSLVCFVNNVFVVVDRKLFSGRFDIKYSDGFVVLKNFVLILIEIMKVCKIYFRGCKTLLSPSLNQVRTAEAAAKAN